MKSILQFKVYSFINKVFFCFLGFFFGYKGGFLGGSVVKNLPANAGDMGQEDPLKKEMATYSSILAWEIPWAEAAGGLQSMELHKS